MDKIVNHFATILKHDELVKGIYKLDLLAGSLFDSAFVHTIKPGQFLYIRINNSYDPFLRRPISIHDVDDKQKVISLIYRIEGRGTTILSEKKPGEVLDIMGPLGNGYDISNISLNKESEVVLIGGGIGIPPLYYLGKSLVNRGYKVTSLLGYQSKENSFLLDEFSLLGKVRIATIDGSLGFKGTVIDLINIGDSWDLFYSCGPAAMLKSLQQEMKDKDIEGYFSLEERMGCGIGACYGCIVRTQDNGYKKVCSDGPVFPFREVVL